MLNQPYVGLASRIGYEDKNNIVNEEDDSASAHPHVLSVGEEVVVDKDGGNSGGVI